MGFVVLTSVKAAKVHEWFRFAWDDIYGHKLGETWKDNPWLWARRFHIAPDVSAITAGA